MKNVIIYSTPTCVYCNLAKEFFKDHNVPFQEFNVATNMEKRKEMMDKSGQMGVPVISVGEEIIVGFDQQRISEILGLN